MLWQKQLCESLGLKGRIIISKHGINGTVGGEMSAVKKYVKATRQYEGFKKIVFKWSNGTGNDFPKLQVRVRKELVGFGNPDVIKVDESGVVNGGKHLRPAQVDASEALHRLDHGMRAVVGPGHVACHREHLAVTELRRSSQQRRLRQVHQHQLHPAALQQGRYGQSNATGTPSDERYSTRGIG